MLETMHYVTLHNGFLTWLK